MGVPEEYITLELKDEFLEFVSEIPNEDNSHPVHGTPRP